MSIHNGISYIRQLSDFWVNFYEEHEVIDAHLKSVAEVVKNAYFRILQKQLPYTLDEYPLFREEFWNIIELDSSNVTLVTKEDGRQYFKYALDEAYADVPFLYNIIYNPTVTLRQGEDYEILREKRPDNENPDARSVTIQSYILFKRKPVTPGQSDNGDPFYNSAIAKRINEDNSITLALFAPKSFVDNGDLNKEWGALVNMDELSSVEYARFLEGLFRLYLIGPSIANINAGLTLAAGYPVTRIDEKLTQVEIYVDPDRDINEFIVTCVSGNEYTIPRKVVDFYDSSVNPPVVTKQILPTLKFNSINNNPDFSDINLPPGVYNVDANLNRLESFITDISVVDTTVDPHWWRRQQGSKISNSLVGNLSEELRKDPEVIDFLFSNYLKYNTFGVFIDYRALRKELQLSAKFLDLLLDIKPTFKTFLVYEDDLQVVSIMGAGDTYHGNNGSGGNTGPGGGGIGGDVDYQDGIKLQYNIFIEEFLRREHRIHQDLPIQAASIHLEITNFEECVEGSGLAQILNSDYIYYDTDGNPPEFGPEGEIIL